MSHLTGRVALITGGAAGIGRAIAERFLAEGARVAVLDRSTSELGRLKAELPDVLGIEGDVSTWADNERAVAQTVAAFGGLDTFIGNAGVYDYFASLASLPAERLGPAFDELFGINVKGYFFGAKAALPALLRGKSPSIIFTVSNAGFYPAGGGPLYTASKHAVVGLIRELAYELAPKIRVNGVAPGGTLTGLRGIAALDQQDTAVGNFPDIENLFRSTNPLHIAQNPQDHAGLYALLASPTDARAVTGVIINSDGGLGVRGFTQVAGGTDL